MAVRAEAPNFPARRIALQQNLHDLHSRVTQGVAAGETDIINVTVERPLDVAQLPRHVRALLLIAGANTEGLKLQYNFSQTPKGARQALGTFCITWEDSVSDGGSNDVQVQRAHVDRWQNEVESITVSPPFPATNTDADWSFIFHTNDKGSYATKQGHGYPKGMSTYLAASLEARDQFLAINDHRLTLQEGLVALLDLESQPPPKISYDISESPNVRYLREEEQRQADINNKALTLLAASAKIILGKAEE